MKIYTHILTSTAKIPCSTIIEHSCRGGVLSVKQIGNDIVVFFANDKYGDQEFKSNIIISDEIHLGYTYLDTFIYNNTLIHIHTNNLYKE